MCYSITSSFFTPYILCQRYLSYWVAQDYNSLEKPNKSQITHVDLDLEILDILKVRK